MSAFGYGAHICQGKHLAVPAEISTGKVSISAQTYIPGEKTDVPR